MEPLVRKDFKSDPSSAGWPYRPRRC